MYRIRFADFEKFAIQHDFARDSIDSDGSKLQASNHGGWFTSFVRLEFRPFLIRQRYFDRRRHPNTVTFDDGRRPTSTGDLGAPTHVHLVTPMHRQVFCSGMPIALRPAKLRPLGSDRCPDKQDDHGKTTEFHVKLLQTEYGLARESPEQAPTFASLPNPRRLGGPNRRTPTTFGVPVLSSLRVAYKKMRGGKHSKGIANDITPISMRNQPSLTESSLVGG